MFKLIYLAVTLLLIASNSFANQTGHQIALNLINSDVNNKITNSEDFGSNDFGVGLSYKYHANIGNGYFLAVGAFYDYNNIESSRVNGSGRFSSKTEITIKDTFGGNFDIGYDFNKFYTAYASLLAIRTGAESKVRNNSQTIASTSFHDNSLGYAIGAKYNFNKNYSAGLSYNLFEVSRFGNETEFDITKLELSYNF